MGGKLSRVAQSGKAGGLRSHSKSCLFIACFGPAPAQHSHSGILVEPSSGCSTPRQAPLAREKWLHLLPRLGGGSLAQRDWLQKLGIKGILLLLLPLSILPAALPRPDTWTRLCKHTGRRA